MKTAFAIGLAAVLLCGCTAPQPDASERAARATAYRDTMREKYGPNWGAGAEVESESVYQQRRAADALEEIAFQQGLR